MMITTTCCSGYQSEHRPCDAPVGLFSSIEEDVPPVWVQRHLVSTSWLDSKRFHTTSNRRCNCPCQPFLKECKNGQWRYWLQMGKRWEAWGWMWVMSGSETHKILVAMRVLTLLSCHQESSEVRGMPCSKGRWICVVSTVLWRCRCHLLLCICSVIGVKWLLACKWQVLVDRAPQ